VQLLQLAAGRRHRGRAGLLEDRPRLVTAGGSPHQLGQQCRLAAERGIHRLRRHGGGRCHGRDGGAAEPLLGEAVAGGIEHPPARLLGLHAALGRPVCTLGLDRLAHFATVPQYSIQ
jgi:hypothetical protein